MPPKKNEPGPTSETVRANVKIYRESQNLTYAELSRRLDNLGKPIAVLGLSRIENGERRVDVDDLMALASALDVPPVDLLTPDGQNAIDLVEATGLGLVSVHGLRNWICGLEETQMSTDQLLREAVRLSKEAAEMNRGNEALLKRMEELERHRGND